MMVSALSNMINKLGGGLSNEQILNIYKRNIINLVNNSQLKDDKKAKDKMIARLFNQISMLSLPTEDGKLSGTKKIVSSYELRQDMKARKYECESKMKEYKSNTNVDTKYAFNIRICTQVLYVLIKSYIIHVHLHHFVSKPDAMQRQIVCFRGGRWPDLRDYR